MTHPDDLLADYVDGDLGERERAEVEAHLATCERCRADVRSARLARDQLASEPAVEAPAGLSEEILDAVGGEPPPRDEPVVEVFGGRQGKSSRPAAWLGAVAAAAAIVIGIFVFNGLSGPSQSGTASDARTAGGELSAPAGAGVPETSGVVLQPGHDYDEAGIEQLAAAAAAGRLPVPQTSLAPNDQAATATSCLTKGAQLRGDEVPVQLIQATFHGKPADLGVYKVPGSNGGPERIVIWVVSSRDCSVLSFTQHLLQG
ncbi:MAG TPA: zf-HC2 domain-containing protein [Actinomycetota bacterium]